MYCESEESAQPGRMQAEGLMHKGWEISLSTMDGGHYLQRSKALESLDWIDGKTR